MDNSKQLIIRKFVLEITVFICGAVIMIFEVVGSRIVAPYIGGSIYVWTSIIGVILMSLSIGYYAGGTISDHRPNIRPMGLIIMSAAIAIAFSAASKDVISILISTLAIPLELKSVLIALVLFAPAGILLGMVSPYAAKLSVTDLATSGRTVGNLYAISTAGSIVGTFLAGFYIIPNFGSTTTLAFLSIVLFIGAFLLFLGQKKGRAVHVAIIPFILFMGLTYLAINVNQRMFVADIDTAYNRILVATAVDPETKKPILALATDPHGTQSAIFTDGTDDLVFSYTKFFRLFAHFVPHPSQALMIGGSAYTFPQDFIRRHPTAHMDVVELDPGMTDIAQTYFGFKPDDRIAIYHEDARVYLNNNNKTYDVIFGDAFNSASAIPFQLTTRESAIKQFEALHDGGIVMLNMISSIEGTSGQFARAEYATYKDVFPQVYLFAVQNVETGSEIQNIMLVALKNKKSVALTSPHKDLNDLLAHVWNKPIDTDVPILTDDFAPVEFYRRVTLQN